MEDYTKQDIFDLRTIGLHIIEEIENDVNSLKFDFNDLNKSVEKLKKENKKIKTIKEIINEEE